MKYAKIALALPVDELFDYLIPKEFEGSCKVGARVLVSFGKRRLIGYVVAINQKTQIKQVKPILEVIDHHPVLSENFLKLTKSVSDYYFCSWGEAINSALPQGIRKGMKVSPPKQIEAPKQKEIPAGVKLFSCYDFDERISRYIEEIEKTINQGGSVIVLAPEIRLALRIGNLLKEKYPLKVAVTYRKQKIQEELSLWEDIWSGKISIVVGTRPAVFAPFSNTGLIIVDEVNAYGHKEDQSPYYHAREVALMRARLENITVLLGSSLESVDSYYHIMQNRYELINRDKEEIRSSIKISIIDMKQFLSTTNKSMLIISASLEDKIRKALHLRKKVIVFINRKGYASYAYCKKCGHVLTCDRCSLRLVYYFEEKKLICNSCGLKKELVAMCPVCKSNYIKYAGIGIEKVVSKLHLLFPQAKIARIDKSHAESVITDTDILVVTEMLFHEPYNLKADIVGIIDMDSVLNIIDFRMNEKIYSLIFRLKNLTNEELIIQTAQAQYYRAKNIADLNLENLYQAELRERKSLNLPPFTTLASLNLRGSKQERVYLAAKKIYDELKAKSKTISFFAPLEAVPFKLRGKFRYKIPIKSRKPDAIGLFLKKHLKNMKPSGIIVTLDFDI